MENQIKLEVDGCFCTSCKSQIIGEFSLRFGQQYTGIFGPSREDPSSVESKFYCSSCGLVYHPTEDNKILAIEEHLKAEAKIILIAYPGKLRRDLKVGEVFEIIESPDGIPAYSLFSHWKFVKGDLVRARLTNIHRSPDFILKPKPFIVLSDDEFEPGVVFLASHEEYKDPTKEGQLHTPEYKEIRWDGRYVEAVRVFCERLGYKRQFYIPKDVI